MPSDIHKADRDLYTIQDFQEWHPPPVKHIIWDGVLDVGHRFQIFGDEGSWKSGLALHMAYSIATGHRWLGFKCSPANVLLIQGEMGMVSMHSRNVKYTDGTRRIYLNKAGDVPNELARAAELAYPPNVYMQIIEFLHLDEQAGVASLRRKLDEVIMHSPQLPIVLIIDPLYKVFHHDLTVAKDVSYFQENMDILRHDYNTPTKEGIYRQLAIVFVHHSRKCGTDRDGNKIPQGSDESFGAKQLNWWSDTVMNSSLDIEDETKTTVNLTFTKHGRDAESVLPKLIRARWNRETLHPRILTRVMPSYPEDEVELRGSELLNALE